MKYSAVIVLAPGITKEGSGQFSFSGDDKTFNYKIEGDPFEFRFKAVKQLHKNQAAPKFILVGGPVKNEEGVSKTKVMSHRLSTHYKIPIEQFITLPSVANTEGNALSVLEWISEKNSPYINAVGLLTNFYHLPRAIKIFQKTVGLRLVPICAESLLLIDEFENIKKFYRDEASKFIVKDNKGERDEIHGLLALESESYESHQK